MNPPSQNRALAELVASVELWGNAFLSLVFWVAAVVLWKNGGRLVQAFPGWPRDLHECLPYVSIAGAHALASVGQGYVMLGLSVLLAWSAAEGTWWTLSRASGRS
jgi:hypothetical protein